MAMVGSAALRLCYVTGVIYLESLPAHTTVLIINSKFLPTASYRLTYSIGIGVVSSSQSYLHLRGCTAVCAVDSDIGK